jgi:hypothetical protein
LQSKKYGVDWALKPEIIFIPCTSGSIFDNTPYARNRPLSSAGETK